jgi:hypothetical protein
VANGFLEDFSRGTHSMEQNHSCEIDSLSTNQELAHLWNLQLYYRVHKRLTIGSYPKPEKSGIRSPYFVWPVIISFFLLNCLAMTKIYVA